MGRHTGGLPEGASEMTHGQSALGRQPIEPGLSNQVCAQQLLRAPLLPGRQTSPRRTSRNRHPAVDMRNVGGQRQSDVVDEHGTGFLGLRQGGKE